MGFVDPLGLIASYCDALKQMAQSEQDDPDGFWYRKLQNHLKLDNGMDSGSGEGNFADKAGNIVDIDYTDVVYRGEKITLNSGAAWLVGTGWAKGLGEKNLGQVGDPTPEENVQQNLLGVEYGLLASYFDSLMDFWKFLCEEKNNQSCPVGSK